MSNLNFVAIDFETSETPPNSYPCQLGVAIVKDGIITDTKTFMIKPPHNKYHQRCIDVHGILPEHTENEPEFPEVWPHIKPLLENKKLVAHNSSFDWGVLNLAANYYNIDISNVQKPECTRLLNNGAGLKDCCKAYGVDLVNHHDGESDAIACANLYIKYHTEGPRVVSRSKKVVGKEGASAYDKKAFKTSSLFTSSEFFDPSSPFLDKRIVFTGDIDDKPRAEVAKQATKIGAIVVKSSVKNIDIVVIGDNPGRSKIDTAKTIAKSGRDVYFINKEIFKEVVSGNYNAFRNIISEYDIDEPITPITNNISSISFKNVPFCVIGNFDLPRATISRRIIEFGGIDKKEPSKNVQLIIKGDNISKDHEDHIQLLEHDGFSIPSISYDELKKAINGEKIELKIKAIRKKVNITHKFLFDSKIEKVVRMNPVGYTHFLGGKEVFIFDPQGDFHTLAQCLGNIGAIPTREMSDSTDYIWLPESTIFDLKKGNKDKLIKFVEKYYNSSSSDKFLYKFILAEDVMQFLERRANEINDDISTHLLDVYKESAIEYLIKQRSSFDFKEGENHVKVKGKYVLKLQSGRTWVPSRQMEPSISLDDSDDI